MLQSLPAGQVLAPAGRVLYRPPCRRELAGAVSSIWSTQVPSTAPSVRVLPDAAVDLVLFRDQLVVAGPDTRPALESPSPGVVIGVQLRPAAVSSVLGVPAAAVRDARVHLSELWGQAGRDLADRLVDAPSTQARVALLEAACVERLTGARTGPPVDALRRLVREGRKLDPYELGVSERQLRRWCDSAYGYGPRTLTRIIRFQSVLRRLRQYGDLPLSDLAVTTGHVDQSHLAHEVGAFSGLTCGALRRLLQRLPAGVGPDAVDTFDG